MTHLKTALDAGVGAVMFSETYAGGLFRLARDEIIKGGYECLIYGHNGGIGSRGRSIYREVIDFFARLDGIDFRQTAPGGSSAYLRPIGLEHVTTENVLQANLPTGQRPVVIVRAGGLDQGSLIVNLAEVSENGFARYLFLMGSAITGFVDPAKGYDPASGATSVEQVLLAYFDKNHSFAEIQGPGHVTELFQYATERGMTELTSSLMQRYKGIPQK